MSDRVHQLRGQTGQTMAEYAVVLSVITLAIIVTFALLSSAISTELNSVIAIF
jgi:Flp pilus assembly pilin Flp